MSGWGIKDAKTASGTVAITTGGAVSGSSTAFTTQAAVGDFLRVSSQEFIIIDIDNDTTATVINANPQTTWTAVTAGSSYTLSEKPTSLASDPSVLSTNVFGVDTNEAQASAAEGKPVAHAGWVLKKTIGARTQYETLVALSKNGASPANMGDYEDVEFEDYFISITSQPSNSSASSGSAVSFTVAATITGTGGTIVYQWQESTDGGSIWVNISDAGVYSNTATATLNISDNTGRNTYQYRAQLSATGADTVFSSAATLTEV